MELPKEEATRLFDYASTLYIEERYMEALAVLDQLLAYRKNSRRVIFARADCLHRLERMDEAMHICDELIAYHDYEPAKKLRVKLENKQLANLYNDDPDTNPFTLPDFDIDLPPTKIGQPPAPAYGGLSDEEKKLILTQTLYIGLSLLCTLVLAGGLSAFASAQGIIKDASPPTLFVYFLAQLFSYTICLFAVFYFFKKFEKDTQIENATYLFKASAGLSVLYASVVLAYVALPPVIAEIAGLFILNIVLIMTLRFSLLNLAAYFALLFILRLACVFAFFGPQIMAMMGR